MQFDWFNYQFFLILIYLTYEIRKYTVDAVLNILNIFTGSYTVYKWFTIMIDDDTIIGKICFGTSCLIFLTPNSVYIETSLFSSYFWKIHGVFIKDLNIVFPNANGIILAKVQIFIFL